MTCFANTGTCAKSRDKSRQKLTLLMLPPQDLPNTPEYVDVIHQFTWVSCKFSSEMRHKTDHAESTGPNQSQGYLGISR
jgi:hypothetical protein